MPFGNNCTSNRQSNCKSDSKCNLCLLWVQLFPNRTRIHVITYTQSHVFKRYKNCIPYEMNTYSVLACCHWSWVEVLLTDTAVVTVIATIMTQSIGVGRYWRLGGLKIWLRLQSAREKFQTTPTLGQTAPIFERSTLHFLHKRTNGKSSRADLAAT